MNFKSILALFGVMLFGAGLVMAISGATPTLVLDKARWTGIAAAGSDVTEGGNISAVNISGTTLTDRWAAYFGNVSGTIVLRDSTPSTVYTWTWVPASGGEVCLSTAPAYAFGTAAAASVVDAQAIDAGTAFNLGVASDNASRTFTTANCNLVFNGPITISNTANVTTTNGWNTCAIKNVATPTVKADFAFCNNMQAAGTAYDGSTANYQVMIPTTPGSSTEIYYFYTELN